MKIVDVPGINGLGKTLGCELAFKKIIKSLEKIHSNEKGVSSDSFVFDLDKVKLKYDDIELNQDVIYDYSFDFFSNNEDQILFVGGDHSISYPLTHSFLDYCENSGKEPCLIVFDAHPDCMEPMEEPTHEEWLRKLVEKGFPPENILLVGVRNLWKNETKFLKEKGIRSMNINNLFRNIAESCDILMEFANGKELYVSIDIDAVDPVFAPGTGYPEVGGLTSRQLIYLVQRIKKMKNLRAIDLVEINPERDRDDLTVNLGAKIISELV